MDIDATIEKAKEEQKRDRRLAPRRILLAVLIIIAAYLLFPHDGESCMELLDRYIVPNLPGENPIAEENIQQTELILFTIAAIVALLFYGTFIAIGKSLFEGLDPFLGLDTFPRGDLILFTDHLKEKADCEIKIAEHQPHADESVQELHEELYEITEGLNTIIKKVKKHKRGEKGYLVIMSMIIIILLLTAPYGIKAFFGLYSDVRNTFILPDEKPIRPATREEIQAAVELIFAQFAAFWMFMLNILSIMVSFICRTIDIYRKDEYRDLLYELADLTEKELADDEAADSSVQNNSGYGLQTDACP